MEHESIGGGVLPNKCVRRPTDAFESQRISQPSGIRSLKLMAVPSEIVLAAIFLCTIGSFAQSSAMFRGDLAHTGVYRSAAPKNIKHILWEFKTRRTHLLIASCCRRHCVSAATIIPSTPSMQAKAVRYGNSKRKRM
jgi:hypothetical protein